MTYSTIVANAELKEANTNRGEKDEKKKKFDYNLESLRGFLAIFVVIHHVIFFKSFIDPNYFPEVLSLFETPGHLSVLIFFILSGYVIGLSNKNAININSILPYLKKRIVRLYPIYALALIFTLFIITSKYSFQTILSHFTFTQILFSEVIWENAPTWSLHYEVVYYLLFIPISFYRVNPINILIGSIIVGILNYFLFPYTHSAIITSYSFGLTFWSVGLVLAQHFKKTALKTNYSLLLSNLFLILCIYHFNVISTGLSKFSIYLLGHNVDFPESISWYEKAISFLDLAYLPYCIMFVLIFSEKDFKYKKQVLTILQLTPAITFLYLIKNQHSIGLTNFIIPSTYYLLSLLFFFYNFPCVNSISKTIFKKTIWLGSISYAIYIIHFPILLLFKSINFFSGSLFTFSIRLIFFFSILILISYLLDRKLQPWVRQKLI